MFTRGIENQPGNNVEKPPWQRGMNRMADKRVILMDSPPGMVAHMGELSMMVAPSSDVALVVLI